MRDGAGAPVTGLARARRPLQLSRPPRREAEVYARSNLIASQASNTEIP